MLLEARVRDGITEAEATRLAREIYGLDVRARALPGEYDDNFHLTAGEGRAFVLKVMHPAREPWCILRRTRHNCPCRACCRIRMANPSRKLLARMDPGGWFGC